MPVLGTLVLGLFSGLAEFFGKWLSKRLAISTAALATSAALLLTLGTAITGLLSGIASALPADTMLMTGLYIAVPANGPACLSFCLAVDAACAAYRLGMANLRLVAS